MLRGQKTFTLLPPSDIAYLDEALYPSARYCYEEQAGEWSTVLDVDSTGSKESDMVPWIALDPGDPVRFASSHIMPAGFGLIFDENPPGADQATMS